MFQNVGQTSLSYKNADHVGFFKSKTGNPFFNLLIGAGTHQTQTMHDVFTFLDTRLKDSHIGHEELYSSEPIEDCGEINYPRG